MRACPLPDAPCAYLALSPAYREELEQARALGWRTAELAGHHLGMLTDPDGVATSIRSLVAHLA